MLKRLFVFLLLCASSYSQGTKTVKYGNEFLSIGIGGKQLGMGGASVAIVRDVTAGFWNPAALAFVNYPEFILQHDERFGDLINYDYGSIAYPYDKDNTFGLSVIRLGVDGIPDTRNALIDFDGNGILDNADRIDYDKVTYHNAADWGIFLSYAKKYNNNFAYGANVKFIYRSIISNSAFGIGFDAAAFYSPLENFFIGLNLQDITTTYLSWDTGTKELIPPTAKFGVGYQYNLFDGVLTPSVDFDFRFEGRKSSAWFNVGPVSSDLHLGFDYCFKNFLSLRAGFNDIKQLTLGLGVRISKINIDYAFAKFNAENDLGNTHRISIKFTLENVLFKRQQSEEK
jgi:hypothetical protein